MELCDSIAWLTGYTLSVKLLKETGNDDKVPGSEVISYWAKLTVFLWIWTDKRDSYFV